MRCRIDASLHVERSRYLQICQDLLYRTYFLYHYSHSHCSHICLCIDPFREFYTTRCRDAQKHLLGLREFIKRVKQDEIKRRLSDVTQTILEKMLPYAVLFKETDHWLDLL